MQLNQLFCLSYCLFFILYINVEKKRDALLVIKTELNRALVICQKTLNFVAHERALYTNHFPVLPPD